MSTLKWISYIVLSIIVLSVIVASGAFILVLAAVLAVLFTLATLVRFVAYCIKEYVEAR